MLYGTEASCKIYATLSSVSTKKREGKKEGEACLAFKSTFFIPKMA